VLAGLDDGAGFVVGGVDFVDVGAALGLREEAVGRSKVAGEGEAVDIGGEALDVIEFITDFPEHDVHVRAGAQATVGKQNELFAVVIFHQCGEGAEHFGLLGLGQAAEFGQELIEGEGDVLAADGSG